MKLCLNCLEEHKHPATPVGHDRGHQFDSYRVTIDLCARCAKALVEGDLAEFHSRFTLERRITR